MRSVQLAVAFPVQNWPAQLAFGLFTVLLVRSAARCASSVCICLHQFAFGFVHCAVSAFGMQSGLLALQTTGSVRNWLVRYAVGVLSGQPGFLSLRACSVCRLAQFASGVFTVQLMHSAFNQACALCMSPAQFAFGLFTMQLVCSEGNQACSVCIWHTQFAFGLLSLYLAHLRYS